MAGFKGSMGWGRRDFTAVGPVSVSVAVLSVDGADEEPKSHLRRDLNQPTFLGGD